MGKAMAEKFLMNIVKTCSKKLQNKPDNHRCIANIGIAAIEVYRANFKRG